MNATSIRPAPVLLVLEGRHDIEFLRRIGRLLQAHDSSIPDLTEVESRQRLIVLPVGGDNLADQSFRFVRLPFRQLHLYDRESASHSTVRQQIVERLNAQAHVRAFLTGKRSLENYLHSNAIAEVCGVRIPVNDESCLPSRVAQTLFEQRTRSRWESLPSTARRRLRASWRR